VVLGGYCRVEMQPESSLRIEGSPRAEEIRLNRGEVRCSVDRGVGSFRVRTDAGTVSVTGTEFAVSILEELGETRMHVSVSAGSVLLRGIWGEHELKADQEVVLPRRAGEAEPLAEAFGSAVGSPTVEHEGRLYVLRGSTLARMNIRTMEVEARAEVPAAASSAERAVMLARGGMLYVLRGGMLFAFDEKGLELKSSVKIAEPEEAPRMPRWGRGPAEGHGGRGHGAEGGEAPRAKPDEGTDEAF